MDNVNCNLIFPFLRTILTFFHKKVSYKILRLFLSVLHKQLAQIALVFARFRNFVKVGGCFNFFNGIWQY